MAAAFYFDNVNETYKQSKAVTAYVFSPAEKAVPGETTAISLGLSIDEGWHINSHSPVQDHLVPTEIVLKPVKGITSGQIKYPEGTTVEFPFSKDTLSVYEGELWLTVPLKISKDVKSGKAEIRLEVNVQACDDQSCQAPDTIELSTQLNIGAL